MRGWQKLDNSREDGWISNVVIKELCGKTVKLHRLLEGSIGNLWRSTILQGKYNLCSHSAHCTVMLYVGMDVIKLGSTGGKKDGFFCNLGGEFWSRKEGTRSTFLWREGVSILLLLWWCLFLMYIMASLAANHVLTVKHIFVQWMLIGILSYMYTAASLR